MRIKITNRDYTRWHGTNPRGRGWWAFEITYLCSTGGKKVESPVFAPSMTYGEAKQWIRQYVRDNAPAEAASANIDALA